MGALIEMKGKRYGKLTVLDRAPNNVRGQSMWTCLCECGNTKDARGVTLRNGTTASCGCAQADGMKAARRKHGARRSDDPATRRLYAAWNGMKARCRNPKHKDFKYYGARGIEVCERWESFENFVADMGTRPEGKTLDRERVNEGYSPENCRWATYAEQRANQRRCQQ